MRLRALALFLVCLSLPAEAGRRATWTPNGQKVAASPGKKQNTAQARVRYVDTLVIGGGVAGMTVAKLVKAAGRKTALLEASDRIGGRLYTDEEGNDIGGAWNHNANNNGLREEVYEKHGAEMVESNLDRYLFVAKSPSKKARAATDEEIADFRDAKEIIEKKAKKLLRDGKDLPADELLQYGGKWGPLIGDELGELDAGVSLAAGVSGADIFGFGGGGSKDKLVKGGLGNFFTKKFGKGLRPKLNSAVASIDYSDPRWTVVTTTSGDVYKARTVVNTTSTGVLAKGRISFSPALPSWKTQAIDNLKMGVFNKIILEFSDDKFMTYNGKPIDENAWVMNQVAGKEDMAFVVRPYGKNKIVAFVGGDLAKKLEGGSDERATKLALTHLGRLFGTAAKEKFLKATVTRWGQNPYTEGSYSYSAVRDLTQPFTEDEPMSPKEEQTGKRLEWHELMAQPVIDANGRNRIYFAGEAVGTGNRRLNHLYQTSVAGAYVSAKTAAKKILEQLKAEDAASH